LNARREVSTKTDRRLDKWLWFARLAKSRSLAARQCAAGNVVVNGMVARKPSQAVRVGDAVIVPQGLRRRTLRVLALGQRRGPSTEARSLYEETAPPAAVADPASPWTPLLVE
jgi:ribosome-associated heat shock protein Hsp15